MRKFLFSNCALALGLLLACAVAGPAQAATVDTSWCSTPAVYQPFPAWGDSEWYALVPGESLDSFAGLGWTLSGGARITTVKLADGSTGAVLDMPSGSKAVSPPMCIGDGYPTAKTLIRYLAGSSGSVAFTPYDLTTSTKLGTMQLPSKAAWSLTPPVNVLPGAISGWHVMQFIYVAGGSTSEFAISNFAVDPRFIT